MGRPAKLAIATLVVALALSLPTASAHEPERFRACTISGTHCMAVGAAFLYGDTVVIKGRVEPDHASLRAKVLRRGPGAASWRVVDRVEISDVGSMRFRWETRRRDAHQSEPYRFRFKIVGHGRSNATEAYVLFGE